MKREKCHYRNQRFAVLAAFPFLLLSCAGGSVPKYAFTYAAKEDHEEQVCYTDEFFSGSSSEYRADLATASLSFAMASFASSDDSSMKTLTRYKNIENLLASTGFVGFVANEDYHMRSSTDTIGLVFGYKKLEGKTLIYTGIRGANYEMEWASNLSIASPFVDYDPATANPYHFGFHKAGTQLISNLKDYIASQGIAGDIKLWTSGYSRAGATANIAGGLLDQAIDNGEKPLGSQVSLRKEDLYVYCFEPPMGAPVDVDENGKLLARSDKYNNIFCHVNFSDPVPLVAMKEVGYTRFGRDRYYPDAVSSFDHLSYVSTVKSIYQGLPSFSDRGGIYTLDNFAVLDVTKLKLVKDESAQSWTQGLFIKEFVSAFTKYGLGALTDADALTAKLNYYIYLQPAARTVFRLIYQTSAPKGSLIDVGTSLVNNILSVPEDTDTLLRDIVEKDQRRFFVDDLTYFVQKGFAKLGIDFSGDALVADLKQAFTIFIKFIEYVAGELGYLQLVTTWMNLDNIKAIGAGHYPELCLASTRALDPNYTAKPLENTNWAGKYYTIKVPGKTSSISVSNKGKTLVNVVDGYALNPGIPTRTTGKSVEIVLPYGESYDVTVSSDLDVEVTLFDYTYRVEDQPVSINRNSDGSFSL